MFTCLSSLLIHLPPQSTLYPYTTLFRSVCRTASASRRSAVQAKSPLFHSAPAAMRSRAVAASGFSENRATVRASSSSGAPRSEEHTSELQSRRDLVCRLLLEKKKHISYR